MMMFTSKEKLHVSVYSGHLQVIFLFSAKRVIYNMPKGILYITLLAENYQNLKMASIGRNM